MLKRGSQKPWRRFTSVGESQLEREQKPRGYVFVVVQCIWRRRPLWYSTVLLLVNTGACFCLFACSCCYSFHRHHFKTVIIFVIAIPPSFIITTVVNIITIITDIILCIASITTITMFVIIVDNAISICQFIIALQKEQQKQPAIVWAFHAVCELINVGNYRIFLVRSFYGGGEGGRGRGYGVLFMDCHKVSNSFWEFFSVELCLRSLVLYFLTRVKHW